MLGAVLLALCAVETALSGNAPVVKSVTGKYRGHVLKTRDDRYVWAFQGIPYAQPPIGPLRFKEPVKMGKLDAEYEAVDESKDCYQPVFDISNLNHMTTFRGSEDCLYLNVYTPPTKDIKEKLPVFVWIHGGGYLFGTGSTFFNGPEYLLDRDIVLVTINYRLGPLGFLTTGDEVIPGNLGMKDQVMALRWVQENVEAFGGDPNRVTIGGESAGASSVVQHLYSRLSKGLFHGSIAQSGSIDCIWSTRSGSEARQTAGKLADQVNCPMEDESFLSCMQAKPVQQLFMAAHDIQDPMGILPMDFVPVIEKESAGAFLTESSVRTDSDVPLIIGVTGMESVAMPAFLTALNPKYIKMSAVREDLDKLLPVVTYYFNHPQVSAITEKLVRFYFGPQGVTENSQLQLINLVGDMMFNYGVVKRARTHKGKVYLYKFSYKGEYSATPFLPPQLQGEVGHSEDLLYLFYFKFIPHGPLNQQDRAMSDKVIDAWYNFIKTGDPTPETGLWKESERGSKYLDFTNGGLTMKTKLFQDRMDFLDNLDIGTRRNFGHDEL